MIILLVLIITIIVLYAVVQPHYLPTFLRGKDLVLGDVRAKNTYVDALNYRNAYIVSESPTLTSAVPNQLDAASLDNGSWSTGLQGYPGTYILGNNNTRHTVTFQAKPPKGWKADTPVSVRLHFVPSDDTAGDLDLILWYKMASVSQDYNADFATHRITKSIVLNSGDSHLTALFPDIALTGETEQNVILFALERRTGAGSNNTYAVSINCIKVEVMFQINKPGLIS